MPWISQAPEDLGELSSGAGRRSNSLSYHVAATVAAMNSTRDTAATR
jgi:hypothetical protein